jgi:hypothetical protein
VAGDVAADVAMKHPDDAAVVGSSVLTAKWTFDLRLTEVAVNGYVFY